MRVSRARLLAVVFAVALACDDGQAQPAGPANPPLPDRELVIATKEAPPFDNVNDLRSVRVGVLAGSSTVDYLDRQRISRRSFASAQEGLTALQAGGIDAFAYDKPLLTWIVLHDFSTTLRMLDIVFDSQTYAIALPKGSPLRAMLNGPLLEETESDWWQQTLFQYLGKSQSS